SDAWPPAWARPRQLPLPPASSRCWSTASSPVTSSITTPVQLLTTSSTVLVNSSRCANAPSSSASSWSIIPPARCYYILFLERNRSSNCPTYLLSFALQFCDDCGWFQYRLSLTDRLKQYRVCTKELRISRGNYDG